MGRDHFPRVDLAVFVLVDAPTCAGRVEPAILIGFAVEIRVDVAIDLEAILKIAPLVDDVVAIGVGEAAKDFAVVVANDPRRDVVLFLGPNRALGGLFLRGNRVFDDGLNGREGKCLGRRWGIGRRGRDI